MSSLDLGRFDLGEALHLARLQCRVRRVFLGAWIVSLLALTAIFPPIFQDYYPEPDVRTTMVQSMQTNLSTRAMYGVLENPGTIGQMSTWDGGAWVTILCAVMAVLLFNSLHRIQEDSGRTELVRAVGVSQVSTAAAAMLVSVGAAAVLGFGTFVVLWVEKFMVDELTTAGAVSSGVVVAVTFVGFATCAALISVLLPNGHGVNRVGLLFIVVAFIARAIADVEDIPLLNWLSPLGWRGVVKPYTDDSFTKSAVLVLVCVALAALWFVLESNREFGVGRVPALPRRAPRARIAQSGVGLRWILERGQVLTWAVAVAAVGMFLTSLTGSLSDLFEDEQIGKVYRDTLATDDLQSGFLSQTAQMVGILVAIAGVHMVLRLRAEERGGLVDIMRATGIRRFEPLRAMVANALATVFLLTIAGTIAALAAASSLADDRPAAVRSILYGFLGQLGPSIALVGVAVLFVGAIPRFSAWAWAPLAYCVMMVFLGEMMDLPEWAIDLSVFNHTLLADELFSRGWIPALMAAIGLAFTAAGLVAASQREVT